MKKITKLDMQAFKKYLYINEKAKATVDKYIYAIEKLAMFLNNREITKALILEYRSQMLLERKAQTVNGNLSAINGFLDFCGQADCKVKLLKIQRRAFLEESKELSQEEYKRLLNAAKAKGNKRLYFLMITLCATGIRISELRFITVDAVKTGRTEINMKGKNRTVILPKKLRNKLQQYIKEQNLKQGCIFQTITGKPLDRSNICHDMKKFWEEANVNPNKIFPHNLRHLFARTYYAIEKNLAHLADLLGHSCIETTRIYVAVSASQHERIMKKMRLII